LPSRAGLDRKSTHPKRKTRRREPAGLVEALGSDREALVIAGFLDIGARWQKDVIMFCGAGADVATSAATTATSHARSIA
jgi:hypothetical protein